MMADVSHYVMQRKGEFMDTAEDSRGWFGGELKEEKAVLEKIRTATKSPSMTETMRRILRRLGEEMETQGITKFSDADIFLGKVRRR